MRLEATIPSENVYTARCVLEKVTYSNDFGWLAPVLFSASAVMFMLSLCYAIYFTGKKQ